MQAQRRFERGACSLLVMAIALGLPTLSRAATPDGWRLAVAGEPVPAARPEQRDAVMIVDLVAVGPKVGLTVTRGADGAVIVHGRGWREWTAAPGDSFFAGVTSQVFLERPLAIEGAAILVPLEAVATLSGYFATQVPADRRIDLVPPAGPAAASFELAKPPAELAKMKAQERKQGALTNVREMRLAAPPASGALQVHAGVSYIPGQDGLVQLDGDGEIYGVTTRFAAVVTAGHLGAELQSGRLVLDDQEYGWSFAAGDLPSRIAGAARGLRASYRLLPGWQPVITAYLPWSRSANRGLVMSWAENLAFSDKVSLATELGTDTSLAAQITYRGAQWAVVGSFVRRSDRRLGMRHEARLYSNVRVSSDVTMAAGVDAKDPGRKDGAVHANLTVGWPLLPGFFPALRATLRHSSTMTTRTWLHVEHLGLQLRVGPVNGRVAYDLRLQQPPSPTDGLTMNHSGSAGVSLRLGSRADLALEAQGERRSDGSLAGRGTLTASVRPFPSTALEVTASYPFGRLQARIRQTLPEGFALAAEYGSVAPYQPVLGATVDPHLVRVTLTRTWDVETPARGATVSGTLRDRAGKPVVGAIIQLERFRVATEADGSFAFSPLPHGSYVLEVDPASLPAAFSVVGGRRRVKITSASDAIYFELSADRFASIRGVVYQDLNVNGIYDQGEGMPGAPVRLETRTTAPGPDGHFVFHNVVPGRHVVRLAALFIADGYEVDGATQVETVVGDYGDPPGLVTFRIRKKHKAIIFTTLPADPQEELHVD